MLHSFFSGDSKTVCASAMKQQFLYQPYEFVEKVKAWNLGYLIVEATPPRRMASGCSVNGRRLAKVVSPFGFTLPTAVICGDRKNRRPSACCTPGHSSAWKFF